MPGRRDPRHDCDAPAPRATSPRARRTRPPAAKPDRRRCPHRGASWSSWSFALALSMLEPRKLGKGRLATMHAHPSHLGAAIQRRHGLPGIQQTISVECVLDGVKAFELRVRELHAHLIDLFDSDAVLAGDRASDLDAQLENSCAESLGLF